MQRAVRIGDSDKNLYVKRRAILNRLQATQPARAGALRTVIQGLLEGQGMPTLEAAAVVGQALPDLEPLLTTIADILSRDKNQEFEFDSWDAAVDALLDLSLPVTLAKATTATLETTYAQAKATAGTKAGGFLAKSEAKFRGALAEARQSRIDFYAWRRAIGWAQAQINELRLLNPPKAEGKEKEEEKEEEWSTVGSQKEERTATHQGYSVTALALQIDAHGGDADAISLTFNKLINGLEAQGIVSGQQIVEAYRSVGDKQTNQFSIEVRIPLLENWVIHVHCKRADGATASGKNPIHYKNLADKYTEGRSIALTSRQERLLLPPPAARKEFYDQFGKN